MQDTLNIALIGCGGIAQSHWRGIQTIARRLNVTAVVDENSQAARNMADQTGATAFTDLDRALESGLFEAVDIMLPHDLHEATTRACLEAGLHVVLEKPLAATLDSAERILALATNYPAQVFMVAEQAQYWTDVIEARKLIDQGAIGEVLNAKAVFYDPMPSTEIQDPPFPWRYSLAQAGGGLAIDGGAHWIRPLRMLLGEVDEVIAQTGRHFKAMEGESWAQAIFIFESGVSALFDAYNASGPIGPVDWFRVLGTDGELVLQGGPDAHLVLFDRDNPNGKQIMPSNPGRRDSFGHELADFSSAVLEGTPLAATAEYALGELRTALAMYRSMQTRKWEKVWIDN